MLQMLPSSGMIYVIQNDYILSKFIHVRNHASDFYDWTGRVFSLFLFDIQYIKLNQVIVVQKMDMYFINYHEFMLM